MHALAKFIFFKVMRWQLIGDFPSHVKKCVIIVISHTSNADFFMGLLVRRVLNEQINWIGKKSLFKFPYGWIFKLLGGAPVDRSKNNDMVKATAEIFEKRQTFRLTLAPEGTRKKVDKLKTGFYYIAKTANVPVVMVAFDYGKKQIKISQEIYTSDNKEADFTVYYNFFEGVLGKIPENSFKKE